MVSKKKRALRNTVNKINKKIGNPANKGEQYYLLKQHSKVVIAKSDVVIDLLTDTGKKQGINNIKLAHIVKWLDKFKIILPKKYPVEVLNQIKIPKSFKIDNLPDSINLKNTDDFVDPIVEALDSISFKQAFNDYQDADNPIAVRLSDGRQFIESLTKAIYAQQPAPAGLTEDEREWLASIDVKTATSWQSFCEDKRGFSVVAKNVVFATTTETPIMLLRNPTTNTYLRVKEVLLSIGKVNLSALFTLYRNPTITTVGTPLPTSNFFDDAVGSQMLAYLLPTTTAHGDIHEAYGAYSGTFIRDNDLAFYIEPQHDLLITIQPSLKNNPFTVGVTYGEELVQIP